MTRQPKNEAFARTSFLQGANAAYIEEMQAQYERNPGSVSDEWRHFFASLQEDQGAARADGDGGPSWAKPLERSQDNRELIGALTGDYGATERQLRDNLQARASQQGFEMSPAASLRAIQDSIRALMLIRAYRVMGHLAADLDPLGPRPSARCTRSCGPRPTASPTPTSTGRSSSTRCWAWRWRPCARS